MKSTSRRNPVPFPFHRVTGLDHKTVHRSEHFVYYESIKREIKIRPIYECRCDERLQTKAKEFTHLGYTGLIGGLEHLKIETRLINEKITNDMGECVI